MSSVDALRGLPKDGSLTLQSIARARAATTGEIRKKRLLKMLTLMSRPAIDCWRSVWIGCDAWNWAPANENVALVIDCPMYSKGVTQKASSESQRVSTKTCGTIGPG